MKKIIRSLCISMAAVMFLAACGSASSADTVKETAASETDSAVTLPDTLVNSYYSGQSDPACEYFKHSRIQKFFAMWVEEETDDFTNPVSNFESFTEISVRDYDLSVLNPDKPLYYCTFSDGADRYGYVIVEYNGGDPSIINWGVTETTPCLYDLRANEKEIAAALIETDIDLSTAKASRVYLYDKDQKMNDQAILFTDEKGDNYICYLGEENFCVEKW
ncbi:hypothetical protein C0033_23485 [Clostridium sp. chh4-2]|uniref:hypothetical protein n=1 Tax=Clostridium sp. chh4-2 TaxID=2067550 RepID=UPI000CCDEA58|nr:hypothetical protein [Clostridium sp. chh4-2]PNV59542.1 hypothetical protein C0033_23485 [Clostridium sp. chh4-2]